MALVISPIWVAALLGERAVARCHLHNLSP
jgi:hypothetical protein